MTWTPPPALVERAEKFVRSVIEDDFKQVADDETVRRVALKICASMRVASLDATEGTKP